MKIILVLVLVVFKAIIFILFSYSEKNWISAKIVTFHTFLHVDQQGLTHLPNFLKTVL